jgi:serine/threonine protein phosphatase 1
MKKYFVVADVHSFYDEMIDALMHAGFEVNNPEHIVICCGDMMDRGNKSREMLDFFYDLHKSDRAILIRGNHEDLFEEMIERGIPLRHDESNGTVKTLANLQDVKLDPWDIEDWTYAFHNYDKR